MYIHSSLTQELLDKEYRDAYVASQIRISLPLQTRAIRKGRGLTQPELAKLAGMKQPRISEIERPGERNLNIETLLRLASAFDVALQVRFVPYSELIEWGEGLDLDNLKIKPFTEELKEAEEIDDAGRADLDESDTDLEIADIAVATTKNRRANVVPGDVFDNYREALMGGAAQNPKGSIPFTPLAERGIYAAVGNVGR